jgi:hypothetical protein
VGRTIRQRIAASWSREQTFTIEVVGDRLRVTVEGGEAFLVSPKNPAIFDAVVLQGPGAHPFTIQRRRWPERLYDRLWPPIKRGHTPFDL